MIRVTRLDYSNTLTHAERVQVFDTPEAALAAIGVSPTPVPEALLTGGSVRIDRVPVPRRDTGRYEPGTADYILARIP